MRSDPWIEIDGQRIDSFDALVEALTGRAEGQEYSLADAWSRPAAPGTVAAFERRLHAAAARRRTSSAARTSASATRTCSTGSARSSASSTSTRSTTAPSASWSARCSSGCSRTRRALGTSRPLVFVVLDELNKYAPREGSSPIKEVLLDIAERGRSLGIVLIGAQQTASEVEGRIVQNAALRVVGRLDPAEAERAEYGFLTAAGSRPRVDPQARHDDRAPARDPDAAARALPVPGLGHSQERGGRGRRGRPVRGLPRSLNPASRLTRRTRLGAPRVGETSEAAGTGSCRRARP